MKLKFIVFSCSILLVSCVAAAENCITPNTQKVLLSGSVFKKTFFGPPGYGMNPATDSKETQLLLKLDAPICANPDPELGPDGAKNETEITIVAMGNTNFTNLVGTHVEIGGTIFLAMTGHHHTPILIQAQSVKSK